MTKYKTGNIVTGSVTGIEKYGAFINLDDYYNGLIHISEITDEFVKDINDYVKLGETITAKVISVDEETFHVKLSIKNISNKPIKKKRTPIVECGSGFGILSDNLDKWIKIKKI